MTDLLRQEVAASTDTIVVKVGTRVLTSSRGSIDIDHIHHLADQLNRLIDMGKKVVLVSSGAVGTGMAQLGMTARPADLARLQAVAAVGQARLIQMYDQALQQQGRCAAQVLLTAGDLDDRTRYLNVRNTLLQLLEIGAVPIINENDTVAVDELMPTFGDNDRLAAMVTNLIQAPLLVLLSDVEGLYDGDPSLPESKLIPTITKLDAATLQYVKDRVNSLSRGGMASKLNAARIVSTAGASAIIASGRRKNVLPDIARGEPIGTIVLPVRGKTISPWKRWIGFSAQSRGKLTLDAGAQRAIVQHGRSLLAIGVVEVQGEFFKGDVVTLVSRSGQEIGRGLINYSAAEMQRIKTLRSEQIAQVLGHCPYEEVIHRNNMVVTVMAVEVDPA